MADPNRGLARLLSFHHFRGNELGDIRCSPNHVTRRLNRQGTTGIKDVCPWLPGLKHSQVLRQFSLVTKLPPQIAWESHWEKAWVKRSMSRAVTLPTGVTK